MCVLYLKGYHVYNVHKSVVVVVLHAIKMDGFETIHNRIKVGFSSQVTKCNKVLVVV